MKKFNLPIFILFFCLTLIASLLISYKFFISKHPASQQLLVIKIGQAQFQVEVAQTGEQRQVGLSNRESLSQNQGMLFIYEQPQQVAFWMKDMNFGLDFVWIKENQVIAINKNVQPEDYQPPQVLQPEERVDMVLEINAGSVNRLGIGVGDKVEF